MLYHLFEWFRDQEIEFPGSNLMTFITVGVMLSVRSPKHTSFAVAPGSTYGVPHSSVRGDSPMSPITGGALSFTVTVRTTGEVNVLPDGSVTLYSMVNWPGAFGVPCWFFTMAAVTSPAHASLAVAPGSSYGPLPHS